MKVIHVLRKPCSEPTVAANVLRHGVGALNIDGCRVEGGASSGGSISGATALGQGSGWNAHTNRTTTIDRTMPAGRWPANLVLQHLDGCVQDGTRRVKASGFDQNKPPRSTGLVFGKHRDTPQIRHSDPDGTETVTAWACEPGCPVAALDAQVTGEGASRFFKQVSGKVGGEE